MSKKPKTFEEILKIYEQLTEKLENIDENTNLSELVKELKKMQKDLDVKE